MERLTLYICNGTFLACSGIIAKNFSEKLIVAGAWKCEISESNTIYCTAVKKFSRGSGKIKVTVSTNGMVEIGIIYTPIKGSKKTQSFKKKFDVYSSIITITLDTNINNIKVSF